jgi:hypothetical protein
VREATDTVSNLLRSSTDSRYAHGLEAAGQLARGLQYPRYEDNPMLTQLEDTQPLREPLAELERELIEAYVAAVGHDWRDLLTRSDADARRLLIEGSRYASAKLSEVEARSHYLHRLHGEA